MLEEHVRRIRLDLEHRGITVLRSGSGVPWPGSKGSIDSYIAQSLLSVHLLGSSALYTEDSHSPEMLGSLEAAFDFSLSNPQFPIFVWCGSDDRSSGSLRLIQDQLLAHREREIGPSTEIVLSSLEDFKSLVYDKLDSLASKWAAPPPPPPAATSARQQGSSQPELYVIYDQQDRETAKPITEFLQGQGVTVLESVFEGDQGALRTIHNEYLRRCDAALIIYGRVREPWVRMKQQDLLRAPALGRRKSLSAKGVLLCSQMTDLKMRFTAPDMMVINETGSVASGTKPTLSVLTPFLQKLAAA